MTMACFHRGGTTSGSASSCGVSNHPSMPVRLTWRNSRTWLWNSAIHACRCGESAQVRRVSSEEKRSSMCQTVESSWARTQPEPRYPGKPATMDWPRATQSSTSVTAPGSTSRVICTVTGRLMGHSV